MSNRVSEDEQFLSTNEVARIFSVTRETIIAWIESGKLDAIKLGGRHRVRLSSVKALANQRYGE